MTHRIAEPRTAVEMERALLGALLSDEAAMSRVAHLVSPESFYRPDTRALFAVLIDMYERGTPIDLVTVSESLRANKKLDSVGGVAFLADLAAACPTSANAEYYATEIEKAFYHRSTQRIIIEAHEKIQQTSSDAEEVMTTILEKSAKLRSRHGVRQSLKSSEAVRSTLALIEHVKGKHYTGGIQTGLERLDSLTVEFDPGELIFIAARPSIGKTALAQTIAEHNAVLGIQGLIFSLEMPIQQIVQRTISRQSGVPLHIIRSRQKLSDHFQKKIEEAGQRISGWPLIYDGNRYENARQIGNAIRACMVRNPIKFVVIDQLSKIVPDSGFSDKDYRMHLNSVISGVKNIATTLGLTIFLLHQINRDVKDVKDYRPRIDDLKDTGKAEEDADGVILIHRPEYYNDPKIKKLKVAGRDYDVSGHAEIIVAKRRQGATGSAAVGYIGNITKFYNLDEPAVTSFVPEQEEPPHPSPPEELPF